MAIQLFQVNQRQPSDLSEHCIFRQTSLSNVHLETLFSKKDTDNKSPPANRIWEKMPRLRHLLQGTYYIGEAHDFYHAFKQVAFYCGAGEVQGSNRK